MPDLQLSYGVAGALHPQVVQPEPPPRPLRAGARLQDLGAHAVHEVLAVAVVQQVAQRDAGGGLLRVELEGAAVALARLHLLGARLPEKVAEERERRGLRWAVEGRSMQERVVRRGLLVPAHTSAPRSDPEMIAGLR